MPPKNKGTGKKPGKTRTPTLIDGLTKDEMSKEQLEEHIVRLREELDREREERNYFQQERDNIHTYGEITDRQLDQVKAELQNLDKEIEENEGRHQVEIKVYKQKMKHLLCEHQNTVSELKAEGLVSTEVLQKEQEQLEDELHQKMRAIMVDMQKLNNENLFKELEMKLNEEITQTRDKWEMLITESKSEYEKKTKLQQQKLDNMLKMETSEREDQWNSHIAGIKEEYAAVFSDTDAVVNLIKKDGEFIVSLKLQVKSFEEKLEKTQENWRRLLKHNRCLAERLLKIREEIAEKEKKIKHYGMKEDANEKVKKKELNDLKLKHKDLEEKFKKLQLENDEQYKASLQSIEKVQHKADVQTMQLERKLKALTDSLEKTQTQLHSVLTASNMDQIALSGVTKKIEEKLEACNNSIKGFQYKKALISKNKDLLLTYKAKQRAFSQGGVLSLAGTQL